MDFFFFVMYNMYYKNGKYENDRPAFTVFIQFCAAFSGFNLGIIQIYYWLTQKDCNKFLYTMPMIFLAMSVALLMAYFLIFYKERYKKIYEKYKNGQIGNHIITRFIVVIIMFSLLLFGLIIMYFKKKYNLCF
jgi:heme/copper-type cytochrome/quinol oxidase subunit 2